jgi:prepilin peptidase CpaA
MNLMAAAPIWLIWVFVVLMVAAAIEDAARLRIRNLTCGLVAAGAVVAMIAAGPSQSLWQNFLVFSIILVVGMGAFAAGLFGGGDVKLLATIGLWLDLSGGMLFVAAVFVAGGVVAIGYIVTGLVRRRPKPPAKSRRVPYGVAIALGALFSLALARESVAPDRPALPPSVLSIH